MSPGKGIFVFDMITFLGVSSVLTFCSRQAAGGTTQKELNNLERPTESSSFQWLSQRWWPRGREDEMEELVKKIITGI